MEERSSRSAFLRRAGVMLAAGIGVAIFPGGARALGNCCPSSCKSCTCGNRAFYCNCGGPGFDYCVCSSRTSCYSGPC